MNMASSCGLIFPYAATDQCPGENIPFGSIRKDSEQSCKASDDLASTVTLYRFQSRDTNSHWFPTLDILRAMLHQQHEHCKP